VLEESLPVVNLESPVFVHCRIIIAAVWCGSRNPKQSWRGLILNEENKLMKRLFPLLIGLFVVISLTLALPGQGKHSDKFQRIEQWQYTEGIFGRVRFSFAVSDGGLISTFFKTGPRFLTPKESIAFSPRGQGPSDLSDIMAGFPYANDIAFTEMPMKIKVFTKKNGTYVWKATKWLKMGKYPQIVRGGLYFDNKIFQAGMLMTDVVDKHKKMEVYYINVYNDEGKHLKSLVKEKVDSYNYLHQMKHHLAAYEKNRLFFLWENRLEVVEIDADKLIITNRIKLQQPTFYKAMPKSFYARTKQMLEPNRFLKNLETWISSYSAISKAFIDDDYLVLQVRTLDEKLKKFAFLFYNIKNGFKLEREVLSDDYLLAVREGKYFCYANGNPGLDDEAEEFIINIYRWKQ
jgi:hypothetical protein